MFCFSFVCRMSSLSVDDPIKRVEEEIKDVTQQIIDCEAVVLVLPEDSKKFELMHEKLLSLRQDKDRLRQEKLVLLQRQTPHQGTNI